MAPSTLINTIDILSNKFAYDTNVFVKDIIKKLSDKYDFSNSEALEFLNIKDVVLQNNKKEKKQKKEKKEGTKKMSGYLIYSNHIRVTIKQELEDENGEKPKPTEVIRAIALKWKYLSDEEKEKWNTDAKSDPEEGN